MDLARLYKKLVLASMASFSALGLLRAQDLLITGVIDGPLSGGLPKAIEVYALNDIGDLSVYGLGSANNGGGTDGEEFTFPAVSVSSGQFIYVASASTGFEAFFGFTPDYTSSMANINGDDAIELFANGTVVDILGEIEVDGTGQPWEHTDGWAYRVDQTGPDGATFALANWTFSEPNALDGETTNASAATPFPIGRYNQPDLLISGVIDGPVTGGLPKAVELFVMRDIANLSIYGLGSANNGGGSDGEEFTFPAVAASSGQFIYVASEAIQFTSFFGFAPDYTSSMANINGDDAIELFQNGGVVDIFGEINVDGSRQPWEYQDGWAYRENGTGPDGVTFILANWNFSGPNALDGETGNGTAATPFPLGTYSPEGDTQMPVALKIHEVQGSGERSPRIGELVSIEGIVIGDFQGADGGSLSGFFVQEEDADADGDPLTSEGVFVFDGETPGVDVQPGDKVEVIGEVGERFGQTEIQNATVNFISGGNPLPALKIVALPVNAVTDLERYEGMYVQVQGAGELLLTVNEIFNLDNFGLRTVSVGGPLNGRLLSYTQQNAPSVAGFSAFLQDIERQQLIIDDGRDGSNQFPIPNARGGNDLSPVNTLRGGDQVASAIGALAFAFGDYRLHPTEPVNFQPANPRPTAAPPLSGSLKVVSFNVLNFFNGNGDGTGFPTDRGAVSFGDFQRQTTKIVAALAELDADIVGLQELENDGFGTNSAIQDLVDALNAKLAAEVYRFVDPGTANIGSDRIAVGLIYKSTTVEESGTAAILDDANLPAGFTAPIFTGVNTNRAVLAQTFRIIDQSNPGFDADITIAVNHFKSKRGIGSGPDADQGDGQGNWNNRRTQGAQALTAWLETNPTGNADKDVMIIGDLNAYLKEDPVNAMISEGYVNLFPDPLAYSFVFDGQWGSLDHALASMSLNEQVVGTAKWHVNADEPDALGYSTVSNDPNLYAPDFYHNSDHDPLVIGLDLQPESPITTFVLVNPRTGQDVAMLEEGDQIDLQTYKEEQKTRFFTVRVKGQKDAHVESVKFRLTGRYHWNWVESRHPYTLFGDLGRLYFSRKLRTGKYHLTATPFSGNFTRGEKGIPASINFEVVSGKSNSRIAMEQDDETLSLDIEPAAMHLYPNPSGGVVNFSLHLNEASSGKFEIYNALGKLVFSKAVNSSGVEVLDMSRFGSGIFVASFQFNDDRTSKRFVVR